MHTDTPLASVQPRSKRSRFSKRITRSVAAIIVERHSRVREASTPPIRLASETLADLDDVSFTVQTVDAMGDFVSHRVVIDREGRVRRICTAVRVYPFLKERPCGLRWPTRFAKHAVPFV